MEEKLIEEIKKRSQLNEMELKTEVRYEKRIKTLISNNFCKYYNYFSFSYCHFNFNS